MSCIYSNLLLSTAIYAEKKKWLAEQELSVGTEKDKGQGHKPKRESRAESPRWGPVLNWHACEIGDRQAPSYLGFQTSPSRHHCCSLKTSP